MPSQKQPRLKESCDACAIAKVRCNKAKPDCSRCEQKGFTCGYSFSRRAGRKQSTATSISSTTSHSHDRSRYSSRSSPVPNIASPSATSSSDMSPRLDPGSPNESDMYDLWPGTLYTPPSIAMQQQQQPQQLPWDDDLYCLQDVNASLGLSQPHPMVAACSETMMGFSLPAFEPADPSLTAAPMMARASTTSTIMSMDSWVSDSSSGEHKVAVEDELANLTEFAETMERKFDSMVRSRLHYRDACTELFAVPAELDTASVERTPDAAELGFYYSLAELRRRLKWLREDVGVILKE